MYDTDLIIIIQARWESQLRYQFVKHSLLDIKDEISRLE